MGNCDCWMEHYSVDFMAVRSTAQSARIGTPQAWRVTKPPWPPMNPTTLCSKSSGRADTGPGEQRVRPALEVGETVQVAPAEGVSEQFHADEQRGEDEVDQANLVSAEVRALLEDRFEAGELGVHVVSVVGVCGLVRGHDGVKRVHEEIQTE